MTNQFTEEFSKDSGWKQQPSEIQPQSYYVRLERVPINDEESKITLEVFEDSNRTILFSREIAIMNNLTEKVRMYQLVCKKCFTPIGILVDDKDASHSQLCYDCHKKELEKVN